MIYTTLNKIRAHEPCTDGWVKLLRHLGKTEADDEPLSLLTILESNGLSDALWSLQACDGIDKDARLYAVWCARQVQHLMTDPRSIAALDVAERYANGQATDVELAAAWAAARAADVARDAARAAAWASARAADVARDAARDAAWAAAWDAAVDTARAAARAASEAAWAARDASAASAAARDAARAAAWAAARDAARDAQKAEFRRVFCKEDSHD